MSLASLKRRIRPGTKLLVLSHWNEKYLDTVRTVTKVQGNGFYFTFGDQSHWSPYPKASRLAFPSEDSFTVLPDENGRSWTLAFLKD